MSTANNSQALTLSEVQQVAQSLAKKLLQKYNQDPNDPNLKYKQLAKIQEEMGELAEQVLKSDSLQRGEKGKFKSEDLVKELSDVAFTAFMFAAFTGVDLAEGLTKRIQELKARN